MSDITEISVNNEQKFLIESFKKFDLQESDDKKTKNSSTTRDITRKVPDELQLFIQDFKNRSDEIQLMLVSLRNRVKETTIDEMCNSLRNCCKMLVVSGEEQNKSYDELMYTSVLHLYSSLDLGRQLDQCKILLSPEVKRVFLNYSAQRLWGLAQHRQTLSLSSKIVLLQSNIDKSLNEVEENKKDIREIKVKIYEIKEKAKNGLLSKNDFNFLLDELEKQFTSINKLTTTLEKETNFLEEKISFTQSPMKIQQKNKSQNILKHSPENVSHEEYDWNSTIHFDTPNLDLLKTKSNDFFFSPCSLCEKSGTFMEQEWKNTVNQLRNKKENKSLYWKKLGLKVKRENRPTFSLQLYEEMEGEVDDLVSGLNEKSTLKKVSNPENVEILKTKEVWKQYLRTKRNYNSKYLSMSSFPSGNTDKTWSIPSDAVGDWRHIATYLKPSKPMSEKVQSTDEKIKNPNKDYESPILKAMGFIEKYKKEQPEILLPVSSTDKIQPKLTKTRLSMETRLSPVKSLLGNGAQLSPSGGQVLGRKSSFVDLASMSLEKIETPGKPVKPTVKPSENVQTSTKSKKEEKKIGFENEKGFQKKGIVPEKVDFSQVKITDKISSISEPEKEKNTEIPNIIKTPTKTEKTPETQAKNSLFNSGGWSDFGKAINDVTKEKNNSNSTITPAQELQGENKNVVKIEKEKTIEEQVKDFYSQHNPAKINEIPQLLEKYKGRELQLIANLEKKYGKLEIKDQQQIKTTAPPSSLFSNAKQTTQPSPLSSNTFGSNTTGSLFSNPGGATKTPTPFSSTTVPTTTTAAKQPSTSGFQSPFANTLNTTPKALNTTNSLFGPPGTKPPTPTSTQTGTTGFAGFGGGTPSSAAKPSVFGGSIPSSPSAVNPTPTPFGGGSSGQKSLFGGGASTGVVQQPVTNIPTPGSSTPGSSVFGSKPSPTTSGAPAGSSLFSGGGGGGMGVSMIGAGFGTSNVGSKLGSGVGSTVDGSGGVNSIEQQVRLFYSQFNPSKLGEVPQLLEKYRGRELQLLANLEKKYGKLPAAQSAFGAGSMATNTSVFSSNNTGGMSTGSALFSGNNNSNNSGNMMNSGFGSQQTGLTNNPSVFGNPMNKQGNTPFSGGSGGFNSSPGSSLFGGGGNHTTTPTPFSGSNNNNTTMGTGFGAPASGGNVFIGGNNSMVGGNNTNTASNMGGSSVFGGGNKVSMGGNNSTIIGGGSGFGTSWGGQPANQGFGVGNSSFGVGNSSIGGFQGSGAAGSLFAGGGTGGMNNMWNARK